MQLIIDIPSSSLGEKIIQILNVFQSDGVKINRQDKQEKSDESLLTKEYIKENWKELVMTNEDPYISDNDRMEEAHAHWKED